ncbi:thioredoxin [Clostridiales bacterium COT073_COT-073]|nr:thioredoxin [Clostridiales bacterium COT073_COT-073]
MTNEKMNDGEMAMDFALMDKNGNEFSLSKAMGKKVYIKFWASWCSICLAGLEELNTLAGKDNDFEIVTIVSPNVRGEQSQEEFSKWFDTLGYDNVRVLFDEGGKVADTYGVRAFPTSALIGSDGVLTAVRPGHMSAEMVEKAFAEIK